MECVIYIQSRDRELLLKVCSSLLSRSLISVTQCIIAASAGSCTFTGSSSRAMEASALMLGSFTEQFSILLLHLLHVMLFPTSMVDVCSPLYRLLAY